MKRLPLPRNLSSRLLIKTALFLLLFLLFTFNSFAQDAKTIADSNNAFAFDLLSRLKRNDNKNLFFSPFSISSALAMTYAGARTETERQMSRTLHFTADQSNFHPAYGNYLDAIESDTGSGLHLDIANSLWAEKKYSFSPDFLNIVTSNYKSTLRKVDFVNRVRREAARKEINNWVEQKTNSKIKDLIAPGILDEYTRMVLVNAIYFNGKWTNKFDKNLTKKDTFHISSAVKTTALFMHKMSRYKYFEDDRIKALEIPYSDKKASMLLILPNEMAGAKTVVSSLNAEYYKKITGSMQEKEVQLSLPKFKTTAQFELSKVLSAMGMPVAFSGDADFSGMSTDSSKKLYITRVIHKACIDVTEEGTEAAAATAVVTGLKALGPPATVQIFKADHPFILIITDNTTGSILFMGEIDNPADE